MKSIKDTPSGFVVVANHNNRIMTFASQGVSNRAAIEVRALAGVHDRHVTGGPNPSRV